MTERDLRTLGPKPAVKKAKKKPDIQAQEAQSVPNRINHKRPIPQQIN